MIANLMASSVSLISASSTAEKPTKKKSSKHHSNQLQQHFGAAQYKHSDSEPSADKTTENISQEDTSDGQGRESVYVLPSHSPEQLSSPRMPLSPMASHGKRGSSGLLTGNPLGGGSAACDSNLVPGTTLGYYGLGDDSVNNHFVRETPMAAFLNEGVRSNEV